jgi:Xaa-Pro aminopeptidase
MNAPLMPHSIILNRLSTVREEMKTQGIQALLVPSSDPHLSEYLPARWQSREWLSGFTGSMGTLVITLDRALLFADSRYWQQAERELAGTSIALFKIKSGASAEHVEWLAANVAANETVAVDGAVMGLGAMRALETALRAKEIKLRTDYDAFDAVWPDRPALPQALVYAHRAPHATVARAEKLAAIRVAMKAANATWHFISTLDDIGYLFNLRGSDVSFNPVFVAHALVSQTSATLYVMSGKISSALEAELKSDGVTVAPYADAAVALATLSGGESLLIDPRRITHRTREAVPSNVSVMESVNPTTFAKSKKTNAERDFVRRTMEQDGAAMAEFYAWFENAQGREHITEVTVDEKLTEARARREGFVSRSFATIAGFKANGALNHYRAEAATAAVIEGDGLLLIDSGGQYLGGTTDITRVWPIGNPANITAEQKRDYTLVLKATIALSVARFPKGVKSPFLDAIARAPIWAAGFDYGHGTGHGVGYFMNVHEGPQSISQAMPEPHTAMEEGMITSIEPGLYRDGKWGIRIENLVLNVPAGNEGFGDFLKFETLTLCPIDTNLIDLALLRPDEVAWLNAYHAEVARRVLPLVSGEAKAWLMARTQRI